jgi:hypothetical protein
MSANEGQIKFWNEKAGRDWTSPRPTGWCAGGARNAD